MACTAAGVGGGSLALAAFVAEHERALTFDFRHFFNLPLSCIGGSITYGEAWHLIAGLAVEQRSHLVIEGRGYTWAATDSDVALITLAEWYTNVHRDTKTAREPFRFPRPWADQKPENDVTAAERAELERKLLERSALQDR